MTSGSGSPRGGLEQVRKCALLCLSRPPNVSAHELPAGKIGDSRSEATSHTVHRLVRSMRLLGRLRVQSIETTHHYPMT